MRVDGVTLVPNYSSWGRWQNLQFLFLISFIRLRSTSSSQIGFLYVARVMEGDVIGCGVDFDDEIIFFTKNGVLAGKYMLLNVVSLECLNMQTGVATFTSYNIERSAKLFISVAYDHPPSGISINAGNSPFQWNPRGKDGHIHRLAIPRSFFDVYGAFYVAGTSWIRENEGIDVSCDGRELRKSST